MSFIQSQVLPSPILSILTFLCAVFAILLSQRVVQRIEPGPSKCHSATEIRSKSKTIPFLSVELYQLFVEFLEPESLRQLNQASRELNGVARRRQFRAIDLLSVGRLIRLASLLSSQHCTIPRAIGHLRLECEAPRFNQRVPYSSREVRNAFVAVFGHFNISISLSLNLPWVISRLINWDQIERHSDIRQLSLYGTYPSLIEIINVLSCMPALEILNLTASFAQEIPRDVLLTVATPSTTCIPSKLKDVTLSSASLQLMPWMCSFEHGPEKLRLVRIRVDHIGEHADSFLDVDMFMHKYGRELVGLYIWFEETWYLSPFDQGSYNFYFSASLSRLISSRRYSFTALTRALRYTPSLRRLRILVPCFRDDEGTISEAMKSICAHLPDSTVVETSIGDDIGIDEMEFWAPPMLFWQPIARRSDLV